MEEEPKKKIIPTFLKIVLLFLAIIVIVVATYEIVIQYDGNLDKTNPMTREEVINLLEKGSTYKNYYYSPEVKNIFGVLDNSKTEYYIKDNIVICKFNGQIINWSNYNTNEQIHIMGEKDGIKYASISDTGTKQENSQMGFDYSLISDREHFNYEFEYLGEKDNNGRKVILVNVWNQDGNASAPVKFVIDKQTGLILDRIDYMYVGFLLAKYETNRNVKMDVVTDQDVEKPNLEGYNVLGLENNN